jgi:hypothetical protein
MHDMQHLKNTRILFQGHTFHEAKISHKRQVFIAIVPKFYLCEQILDARFTFEAWVQNCSANRQFTLKRELPFLEATI